MSLRVEIARFGLKIFAHHRFSFQFQYTNFDPKRMEPYFLIGNHAQSYDPLYLGMQLKNYPYPVANAFLYTKPLMRFGLTRVVKSIVKRKGQSDIQTIKDIINTFQKEKHGVMLFPEGNASYFGNDTPTDYLSTAKLFKKLKRDVIMGKISGGFFAQPRWGKYVKNGAYHIHYYLLLSVAELAELSIEDIAHKIEEAIRFNDYEWNKTAQIPYRSKQKASGLEHYLYACPICESHAEIQTKGNDIYCPKCGKIAHINLYNFLEDSKFETLIEWGDYQKTLIPQLLDDPIETYGELFTIDFSKHKRKNQGRVIVQLFKDDLIVSNEQFTHTFKRQHISGFALTQKNFLSFDYEDQTYDIKVMHPKLILDAMKYLGGS